MMTLNEKKIQLADLVVEIARESLTTPHCPSSEQCGDFNYVSPAYLGQQSGVPVVEVLPDSEEEIFLFETAAKIVKVLNREHLIANSADDKQAFVSLCALLSDPSTYIQFCYIWDKLTEPAKQFFRVGYLHTKTQFEVRNKMKQYIGITE
jgi:hypothetical protein